MKNKNQLIKFSLGLVSIIVLILIISLQIRIHELENEKEQLEKNINDYRLIVEEMEYDLDLPRDDYIEKYAREVLGYHKYSDIIIKEASDE